MIVKAFLAAALLLCGSLASAQWYVGGTLHQSTLREWRHATSANQLATLADIVGKTTDQRDPTTVRPMALEVQSCINVVASNLKLTSQSVAETAVGCMFQLGYYHPLDSNSSGTVVQHKKNSDQEKTYKSTLKAQKAEKPSPVKSDPPIYLCVDAQGYKELAETNKTGQCKILDVPKY